MRVRARVCLCVLLWDCGLVVSLLHHTSLYLNPNGPHPPTPNSPQAFESSSRRPLNPASQVPPTHPPTHHQPPTTQPPNHPPPNHRPPNHHQPTTNHQPPTNHTHRTHVSGELTCARRCLGFGAWLDPGNSGRIDLRAARHAGLLHWHRVECGGPDLAPKFTDWLRTCLPDRNWWRQCQRWAGGFCVRPGRQLGSYGGPIPPPEAADAESAQRRMCVSVFPSNRATLWLLVASFSTPELVFPAGGAVCKQNNRW